jgi:hypothetical protein
MLEAFADDPPELIVFENVPRIATRGRHLLNQIGELLRSGEPSAFLKFQWKGKTDPLVVRVSANGSN